MSGEMEIYLLKADSIVAVLDVLRLYCFDGRTAIPTQEKPISRVWAVKLTISEAANILDQGIDVSRFDASKHDPHGIIQHQLHQKST